MKTKLLTGFTIALAASQALALGELNCSNGDRTLVREEKEIWGANPVQYFIKSELVLNAREFFDEQTKHILTRRINKRDGSGNEVYTIRLKVIGDSEQSATDFVICHRWWDKRVD